jgi:hypothetical protein
MVWAYGLIGNTCIRNLPLKIASNKYGELSERTMKYLVLGFIGLWCYYILGPNSSYGIALAIKLFTIIMFWTYVMKTWSGEK